jgi:hypothetical protein
MNSSEVFLSPAILLDAEYPRKFAWQLQTIYKAVVYKTNSKRR